MNNGIKRSIIAGCFAVVVALISVFGPRLFSSTASNLTPAPTPGLTDCGNGVFVQQGKPCPGGGGGGSTPIPTQLPASTPPPGGGTTSPIAEGDFLDSPGPITGPAIVEFWNELGGANKVCGTFQLPSGESFSYKAGHWWKYKSDQDMQAEWPLHLRLYNQKPENTGCTNGQRPPS